MSGEIFSAIGETVMNMDILNALINGVLVPLMGVVLIPRALREQDTGKYLGLKDVRLIYYAFLIAGVQTTLILPRFGISFEMLFRLMFVTAFPFLLSISLVKISDRFSLKIDYQIRKSNQIL